MTAVSPSTGSPTASTPIQIIGTGFVDGATLTLDGVSAPVTFSSSTLLRGTAPPHAAGRIDVVVKNPGGGSSQLTGGFAYVSAISDVTIGGNLTLQSIGETAQLSATALSADGTTLDVTREARWTVSIASVAAISPDGVVTARSLGKTPILMQYLVASGPSIFRSANIVVTPAGTHALWGRVRAPGAGGVSAQVVHLASGQSIQTNSSGIFTFGALTGSLRFAVTAAGFEDAEGVDEGDVLLDIPLQHVVHLSGNEEYNSTLAPNDVEYIVGGSTRCQPCRMIRVAAPGVVQLKLTWASADPLRLWIDGRMYAPADSSREVIADVAVNGGEARIYVGKEKTGFPGDYIGFSVTQSVRDAGGQ